MPEIVGETSAPAGEPLEVRRSAGVFALATVASAALAVGYATRAADSGPAALWLLVVGLVALATLAGRGWLDARSPLLVADQHGVRLRRGRSWTGIPWGEVTEVVVTEPRGPLRDGTVEVVSDGTGYVVPIGLATSANTHDVAGAVRELAANGVTVVENRPTPAPTPVPPIELSADVVAPATEPPEQVADSSQGGAATALSSVRRSVRASIDHARPSSVGTAALKADPRRESLPEARELRGVAGRPDLVFEPLATTSHPVALDAAPIEAFQSDGADEPVIGPQLAAARERGGLTTDNLAERTRIRPHVIEAIEVDDFAPCGGDFYARGHIRSLARVLGLDGAELVASYDRLYAHAPIDARRVFEAELATGPRPSIRLAKGGPNWAALLGVVLVLAIIWGVGRFVTGGDDAPATTPQTVPTAVANPHRSAVAAAGAPTNNEIKLTGKGEPTKVVVRDKKNDLIWKGTLGTGESHRVSVAGKARIAVAHGNAVSVRVNGKSKGLLGADAERTTSVLGKS